MQSNFWVDSKKDKALIDSIEYTCSLIHPLNSQETSVTTQEELNRLNNEIANLVPFQMTDNIKVTFKVLKTMFDQKVVNEACGNSDSGKCPFCLGTVHILRQHYITYISVISQYTYSSFSKYISVMPLATGWLQPTQNLCVQLTLLQPEGAVYDHHITACPSGFEYLF